MVRRLAWIVAIGIFSALPVHAQRRTAPPVARTVALDVVGPLSVASVRIWIAMSLSSLAACQTEEEHDIAVALAIGPDGSLLSVEPGEGSSAAVTSCVVDAMRRWRVSTRAGSTTTVSLRLRLVATAPPPDVACYCFSWVHGGDHGSSCSTTFAGCEAEAEASMRDRTECRGGREPPGTLPRCPDMAIIDGARMEHP